MPALPQPPLLVITDRTQARRPLEEIASAAFGAGCRWLLLREKDLSVGERLALTNRLSRLAQSHDAKLLVSADFEAARQADGVHLSRDGDVRAARTALGPTALIGFSAHDLAEATGAAKAGADYVTLSPIYESESKPGYGPALGLENVRRVATAMPLPVLALGGITAANAATCRAAGAAGIAVMGPVMRAVDPSAAVREILAALRDDEAATGQSTGHDRSAAAECG